VANLVNWRNIAISLIGGGGFERYGLLATVDFRLARDPGVSGIDSHKPGLLLSMRQQKRQSSGLQNI
jgi:hypothetical protein